MGFERSDSNPPAPQDRAILSFCCHSDLGRAKVFPTVQTDGERAAEFGSQEEKG
jgi:hypothetical protein